MSVDQQLATVFIALTHLRRGDAWSGCRPGGWAFQARLFVQRFVGCDGRAGSVGDDAS
jgi:hypothetical protein